MTYSNLLFIYIFLPAALAVYCIVPKKLKNTALLLGSIIFCGFMGFKMMLFIMLYCIANYAAALFIYNIRPKIKFIPMAAAIIFDIVMLVSFRAEYFSYLHGFMKIPEEAFPLGISLFTLSAIGYLIDVYRGDIKADKNFVRFSLFIMMFPRIIMGPVVSYDIFVSILRKRRLNIAEIGAGLTIFIKGLAKKVILADQLFMLYSASMSGGFENISASSAWLGIISYMFCLYFTLSGFSDMGVGLSRCFGYRFPSSFSYPIFSGRIRTFASHWHIQVIHWFRKYITRPLSSMTDVPLLSKLIFAAVWSLAGFWYGFSWGGVLWGCLMGIAIMTENKLRRFKFLRSNGIFYTIPVIMILSVFLALGDISDAFRCLWAMVGGSGILADSMTAYLLRSYAVVLIATVYASTDLFRNTIIRAKNSRLSWTLSFLTPIAMLMLLCICTSLMSYSGKSDILIINL